MCIILLCTNAKNIDYEATNLQHEKIVSKVLHKITQFNETFSYKWQTTLIVLFLK